jgi:hypothetical protein
MSVLENRLQTNKNSSKKTVSLIILFALIIAVIVLVVLYLTGAFGPRPNKDTWQAVFLTNGQVYFGKLESVSRNYAVLTDIYYLQVSRSLQQPGGENSEEQPNLNLIKLGDELHGPEDAMYIERKNIMFWENLKSSSDVVRAIEEAR